MTSKKTIAERNLTTIQLSKETVQRLRQAESYPRETYDCIIARIVAVHTGLVDKLKALEAYPHEPIESIVAGLIEEHDNRVHKGKEEKPTDIRQNSDKANAAKVFQKELSKITGQ
jgi:hypothetical protein